MPKSRRTHIPQVVSVLDEIFGDTGLKWEHLHLECGVDTFETPLDPAHPYGVRWQIQADEIADAVEIWRLGHEHRYLARLIPHAHPDGIRRSLSLAGVPTEAAAP